MAKPNYQFEKRQRELEKKKKKEDKARAKSAGRANQDLAEPQPAADQPAVAAAAQPEA